MSSRKRSWIQDTMMFRGVLIRDEEVVQYSGPYDTAAKAKTSVTHWKNAGGYGELSHGRDGYIEMTVPEWQRIHE